MAPGTRHLCDYFWRDDNQRGRGGDFIDSQARQAAGAYVPFVVWFNFLAGFTYIIGGIGLFMRAEWSAWLAFAIAASTLVVFGLFLFHIYGGGAYETRTVAAMSIRSVTWILVSITAWKYFFHSAVAPALITPTQQG